MRRPEDNAGPAVEMAVPEHEVDSFDDEAFASGDSLEFSLNLWGRLLMSGWALFLIAGFGLSFYMKPDSRGFGTHQSLGLPPCSFRVWFGIHCPSCGSTTCFSHFVRGEWPAAIQSNVSAFGLALVCAVMIPWCIFSVYRGKMWRVPQPALALIWIVAVLGSISLTQWVYKLIYVPMN